MKIDYTQGVTLAPPPRDATSIGWEKPVKVEFDGAEGEGRFWLAEVESDEMIAVGGADNARLLAAHLLAYADHVDWLKAATYQTRPTPAYRSDSLSNDWQDITYYEYRELQTAPRVHELRMKPCAAKQECVQPRATGSIFCERHRSADSRLGMGAKPLTNEGLAFQMQRDGEVQ